MPGDPKLTPCNLLWKNKKEADQNTSNVALLGKDYLACEQALSGSCG